MTSDNGTVTQEEISIAGCSLVEMVKQKYDEARYSELERCAEKAFTRQHETVDCDLVNTSRQIIKSCLPANFCQLLINSYESNEQLLHSKALSQQIITNILSTSAIDQAAISYLGSEYMPLWYEVSKATDRDNQTTMSFKWHCDTGPAKQLKIIVYLNPTSQHQGNTLLSDKTTTDKLKEIGYVFNSTKYRLSDIKRLTDALKLPHCIESFDLAAGDGILFNPYDLLHRGSAPSPSTPRYTLTLCLIQSPIHWLECINNIYYPAYQYDDWLNVMGLFEHYLANHQPLI